MSQRFALTSLIVLGLSTSLYAQGRGGPNGGGGPGGGGRGGAGGSQGGGQAQCSGGPQGAMTNASGSLAGLNAQGFGVANMQGMTSGFASANGLSNFSTAGFNNSNAGFNPYSQGMNSGFNNFGMNGFNNINQQMMSNGFVNNQGVTQQGFAQVAVNGGYSDAQINSLPRSTTQQSTVSTRTSRARAAAASARAKAKAAAVAKDKAAAIAAKAAAADTAIAGASTAFAKPATDSLKVATKRKASSSKPGNPAN